VKLNYQNFRQNINRYINYLAVIFAFGLGLVKFLIPVSGVMMIVLWILEGNFQEKFKKIRQYKSLIIFFIFILYLFLTLYISADINYYDMSRHFWAGKHETPLIWYIKHYVFYSLILIVLVTSLRKEFTRYIIGAFILGMLINEIVSYLIFFDIIPPFHKGKDYKIVPFFINHSYYSIFLVLAIFLMIIELKNFYIPKYLKIVFYFFIFTATLNLMLNIGRVGQYTLYMVAVITLFYYFKFSIKKIILSLISILIIFICIYNYVPTFNKKLNQTINSIELIFKKKYYNTSLGQRIGMDIIGIEITRQYSLFGVGIDEGMNAKNKWISDNKKFEYTKHLLHFHNNYIQYLVEGGLIGLSLFVLFFIYLFKEKTIGIGKDLKYIIIPIFLLASLTEVPFLRDRSFALFILIYAIILIYTNSSNDYETSNIGRDGF